VWVSFAFFEFQQFYWPFHSSQIFHLLYVKKYTPGNQYIKIFICINDFSVVVYIFLFECLVQYTLLTDFTVFLLYVLHWLSRDSQGWKCTVYLGNVWTSCQIIHIICKFWT
jgi:hypothetical protein